MRTRSDGIFKGYNIIEYKSPDDGLTIDDFFKTIAYACLYKGLGRTVNQIPESEITVSLFRDVYPQELFAALKASGRRIRMQYPGIYYISGRLLFDTQVVVTSQLEGKNHSAFRILSAHAKEEDVRSFIEKARGYTEPGDRDNVDAVLQVSIAANAELYEDIRRDSEMCEALESLMQDVIEDRQREAAQNSTLKNIKSLMDTLKLTAEQAMNALQIPVSEQAMYLKKIG